MLTPSDDDPLLQDVYRGLDEFAKLNKAFIENLQVKQGLIKVELKEKKKTKQVLGSVKTAYGDKKKVGKFDTKS